MNDDALALTALSTFDGLGPARLRRLLDGRSASDLWAALLEGGLTECDTGIGADHLETWTSTARATDLDRLRGRCEQLELTVLTPPHPHWPACLEHDPDPPLVLFRQGVPAVRGPVVAVVGTRRCTSYGRRTAGRLGRELADAGVAVISGLALGVDAESQRAALDVGGSVVGVVGSGLDVVYPKSNRRLWSDVASSGQLWSEWGPGTPPARWRFPARNRLVAAMADALIVVESPAAGGSLHTVDAALERDVPVFAVPGPIDSPASEGTNRLLVQGCAPYTHLDDLCVVLDLGSRATAPATEAVAPSPETTLVLERLSDAPSSLTELVLASGLSLSAMASLLDELESAGLVRDSGGWWERSQ